MKLRHSNYRWLLYGAIGCAIVGVFMALEIFSGSYGVRTNFSTFTPRVGILMPEERIEGGRIIGEPVYFEIDTPTVYEKVALSLNYSNEGQDLIEIGYVTDAGIDLKTLSYRVLDDLDWDRVDRGDHVMYVRPGADPGASTDYHKIATFNYRLPYHADTPRTLPNAFAYDVHFRGSHTFLVNVPQGQLYFDVAVSMPGKVTVEGPLGKLIELEGDQLLIDLKGVAAGVYKVSIETPGDITRVTTPHAQWVVQDTLRLGSGVHTFTTSMNTFTLVAPTVGGVQDMRINGEFFAVTDAQKNYPVYIDSPKILLTAPQGNLDVVGRGVSALSNELFFNPLPLDLRNVEVIPDEIEYVYTTYVPDSEIIFSLPKTTGHRFIISLPGVSAERSVRIEEMEAVFTKERLHFFDYFTVWIDDILQR
jgi:hypothetical protein